MGPVCSGAARGQAAAQNCRVEFLVELLVKLTGGPRRFYDRPIPAALPAEGMC